MVLSLGARFRGHDGTGRDQNVRLGPLACVPERTDLAALARIGESAEPGGKSVRDVLGIAGRRDHAGDRGLGEDVFEEQLRPAGAVEFGCPARERPPTQPAKHIAAFERLVGNDRRALRRGHL